MDPANNLFTYLKQAIKSFLQDPGPEVLVSSMRYYPAWRDHLMPGRNSVLDKTPWITFPAIKKLEEIIRPDMKVFEYGSGGSTLFWAEKVEHIVSVEHDRLWFEKMQAELSGHSVSNVDYLLREAETDPSFDKKNFRNPDDRISSAEEYTGMSFDRYVQAIDSYPDACFDIVIVDGRARPSCIRHSITKLKKGGWLVVDNSDRSYYLDSFDFTEPGWKVFHFSGPAPYIVHFSKTSLFQKKY